MAQARRKKSHTAAPGTSPATPRLDAASRFEKMLCTAEDEARAVLAEHASDVAAALANAGFNDTDRELLHDAGLTLPLVEHNETPRNGSKRRRPCERCEAAQRLLVDVNEVRFHLGNGAADLAVRRALSVGALRLRLDLRQLEDDADRGRALDDGPKGRRHDLLNRELESLLVENPDITADEAIEALGSEDGNGAVVAAEDGSVDWHDSSGRMKTTNREGIKKRLQRLRKPRKHS